MKNHILNQSILTLFVISLFGITVFFITKSHAANGASTSSVNEVVVQKNISTNKLNNISKDIRQYKNELDVQLKLLKKAKTEQEKTNIQAELNEIRMLASEQETTFEMILTTGLSVNKIEATQATQFDWQKDLLEIIQPIMSELRQYTESRRKRDNLQNKIYFYQAQIRNISEALNRTAKINKNGFEKTTLKYFEQIINKWQKRLNENNHLLEVTQLQLDEFIKSKTASKSNISEYVKQFVTGRGATLLLAVIAFVVVYFFMLLLWKGFIRISQHNQENKRAYLQRVITLIYHATMVIFSVTAAFYVLNVRNDQVLIAVAVLLLISIIWVLKNSVPRYIDEIKMLLNAGPVREDECIVYNGMPMKIENLNFYTKLTNPALPGIALRLPLADLLNYVSREHSKNEPWFPCQEGDFVLLSDDTYGMVKCITLENVLLSLSSGMMPKTYSVHDFLAANPKNLSQGFLVTSDFGIDYKYQQQCTTQIPELLCTGIRQGLLQEAYGRSLKDIWVNFAQANTSSLDYKIIVIFDGKAASDYYPIKRALQRYAVEVCNQQQWEIPFSQLVVHTNQI